MLQVRATGNNINHLKKFKGFMQKEKGIVDHKEINENDQLDKNIEKEEIIINNLYNN